MLTINLKVGTYIELKNFEKVVIHSENDAKEVSNLNFEQFKLNSQVSYNFFGDLQISIQGREIMFLEYQNM